jgi:hypothetical protein
LNYLTRFTKLSTEIPDNLRSAWRCLPGPLAAAIAISVVKLGASQPIDDFAHNRLTELRGQQAFVERVVVAEVDRDNKWLFLILLGISPILSYQLSWLSHGQRLLASIALNSSWLVIVTAALANNYWLPVAAPITLVLLTTSGVAYCERQYTDFLVKREIDRLWQTHQINLASHAPRFGNKKLFPPIPVDKVAKLATLAAELGRAQSAQTAIAHSLSMGLLATELEGTVWFCNSVASELLNINIGDNIEQCLIPNWFTQQEWTEHFKDLHTCRSLPAKEVKRKDKFFTLRLEALYNWQEIQQDIIAGKKIEEIAVVSGFLLVIEDITVSKQLQSLSIDIERHRRQELTIENSELEKARQIAEMRSEEIFNSYVYILFNKSLDCQTITDIPLSQTNPPISFPEPEIAIHRDIITVQLWLQKIAQDIQSALEMTSQVNQLTAYASANNDLQTLEEYIIQNSHKSEQSILLLIVHKWTEIIIAASGAIAKQGTIQPVANPFVCGNPVSGDIFVGRDDILRRIEALWKAEKPDSLVIYGHRRMGKSSIILNLKGKLNQDTVLIDFNMQRVGLVNNTAELLHNLALRLYDALEPTARSDWAEPEITSFSNGNVYSIFDRFLTQLNLHRNGKRYAIAIDEFELIEKQIEEKKLEPQLLEYFRSIIQTYPWLIFAFVGLHTLEEMTRNYWEPLFANVTRISVGFLTPAAARRLITQPTPDFNLDYDAEAIDFIIQQTAGQPYLVQLICQNLVSRFNDRNFVAVPFDSAQGKIHSTRFSMADVEAVITDSQFENNGSAYFRGIWGRADVNQQLMLQHLAIERLTDREIAIATQLTPESIAVGLDIVIAFL